MIIIYIIGVIISYLFSIKTLGDKTSHDFFMNICMGLFSWVGFVVLLIVVRLKY